MTSGPPPLMGGILQKPNRRIAVRGPTTTMVWAQKVGRRSDFPSKSPWATHPISEQHLTAGETSPLKIIKLKKD
jgi:hypothetical protein